MYLMRSFMKARAYCQPNNSLDPRVVTYYLGTLLILFAVDSTTLHPNTKTTIAAVVGFLNCYLVIIHLYFTGWKNPIVAQVISADKDGSIIVKYREHNYDIELTIVPNPDSNGSLMTDVSPHTPSGSRVTQAKLSKECYLVLFGLHIR
jgi:hypothetical protein